MAPKTAKSAECELRTLVMSCCVNRMQELNGMLDGESSYVKVEQKSVDLKECVVTLEYWNTCLCVCMLLIRQ